MDHFELVSEYAPHRRSAPGDRAISTGLQRRQPVPDPSRCHRIGQDIHHGECDTAVEQTDADHCPQQDVGSAAIWRI